VFSIDACSEKFFKKLIGNTEVEDALQRLDKLTLEEAHMAAAELLRISHNVENRVIRVDEGVQGVGDKVEGVDKKVQEVGDKVQDVGDGVQDVRKTVQGVDDKVAQINRKSFPNVMALALQFS
jgi:methyl-accepting chemotaxis protein